MSLSASASLLRSEFDDFLFAPIDEDRNGMLLSVLSALARLDVDPWQEAAKLALLPGEMAIKRLALLIAALPAGASAQRDPGTIAARLVALLPRRTSAKIPSGETASGVGETINSRALVYGIVMAFVLGALCVITSRQTPERVDNAQAPASSTVSPQTPPPSSGQ
jgi:hypothetical protein